SVDPQPRVPAANPFAQGRHTAGPGRTWARSVADREPTPSPRRARYPAGSDLILASLTLLLRQSVRRRSLRWQDRHSNIGGSLLVPWGLQSYPEPDRDGS